MWLDNESFRQVVQNTPLVAIDLVVQNEAGELLLGQRLNRPARGAWFVPGGRIQKNETLDVAFGRLTLGELGRKYKRSESTLLGVYEHFYADSVFGEGPDAPSTHYVVVAHLLRWPAPSAHDSVASLPSTQHTGFSWWSLDDAVTSDAVHPNTKAYISALKKDSE